MANIKRCTAFGHREVYKNIEKLLVEAVYSAISLGCTEFLIGDNGMFDRLFVGAVRNAKKRIS